MSKDPKQVEEIFHRALQIASASDRSAYLDEACGDDTSLRQRVEVLLGAHGSAGSFLESPVLDPAATAEALPLSEGRVVLLKQKARCLI